MLVSLVVLWLARLCLTDDPERGYPVYFASFEETGASRVSGDVLPIRSVDDQITEWTKGCPADAFILIKDHNIFQPSGLRKLQRAAENALTSGSFLSEEIIGLRDLGLDLEDYCEGEMVEVDLKNLEALPKSMDTRTRIYYIEFTEGLEPDLKNEVLTAVLGVIPSPFVTTVYASTIKQSHPILRSVQPNPKRLSWQRQKLRHKRDKIAPVIAPLFDHRNTGHTAPEPQLDLPDNFFFTLLFGSLIAVAFLAYRDLTKPKRQEKASQTSKPAEQRSH